MSKYKSKRNVVLMIDMISIIISFIVAFRIRSNTLHEIYGNTYGVSVYTLFFAYAILIYVAVFLVKRKPHLESQSVRDIILKVLEYQVFFIGIFMILFFVTRKTNEISRIFVALFLIGNIILDSIGRLLYREYLNKNNKEYARAQKIADKSGIDISFGIRNEEIQHVYCIGAKSLGTYGGFEAFLLNLLQQHKDNRKIQYHVACKANGEGYMDVTKLQGAVSINKTEFSYCNAHCVLMNIPEKIGSAQAIYYDIHALKWACEHIEKNHIEHPIVYILASRIGPFEKKYVNRIHDAGGLVYQNPDGHEDWRAKWSLPIRKYWKFSERLSVKYADLVVCDSKSIETYIQDEYSEYEPKTIFIAYGSYINPSPLADDAPKYTKWLASHNLRDRQFYTIVGRFVPENNFETIIREFMISNTDKDLAIITTSNEKLLKEIDERTHFKHDKRIKFVGTVYDTELLTKIRENSYGYIHGHSVGGTNPSLLEALGATKLNLLYEVGFNREVAEDAALYWNKDEGNLAKMIDMVDNLSMDMIEKFGQNAKKRIKEAYSWELIAALYFEVWNRL